MENYDKGKMASYFDIGKELGRHGNTNDKDAAIDDLRKVFQEVEQDVSQSKKIIEDYKKNIEELEEAYRATSKEIEDLKEKETRNPRNSFYIEEYENSSSTNGKRILYSYPLSYIFMLTGIACYIIGPISLSHFIKSLFDQLSLPLNPLLSMVISLCCFTALAGQLNSTLPKLFNGRKKREISYIYNYTVLAIILIFVLSLSISVKIAVYILITAAFTGSLLLPIGIDLRKYYRDVNSRGRECRKLEREIGKLYAAAWRDYLEQFKSILEKKMEYYNSQKMKDVNELIKGFAAGNLLKNRIDNLKNNSSD